MYAVAWFLRKKVPQQHNAFNHRIKIPKVGFNREKIAFRQLKRILSFAHHHQPIINWFPSFLNRFWLRRHEKNMPDYPVVNRIFSAEMLFEYFRIFGAQNVTNEKKLIGKIVFNKWKQRDLFVGCSFVCHSNGKM